MSADSPSPKPAIVNPVSRYIGITDKVKATAFYRDILGFSLSDVVNAEGTTVAIEAVNGPARIELGEHDYEPDVPMRQLPLGSAILFFETDDVTAMRDGIVARGGNPSELSKVNWIKMEMFQIVDPDGHMIWFGQSYQQPDKPRPQGQLMQALPHLPLSDVAAGVKHYVDVLGFHINYAQHDLGVMDRDDITLCLIARTAKHTGIGACYFYVRNADDLYSELKARGANVQGEPVSHPWGLRDFHVLDLEGNNLGFGQTFE
jgi:uncharacterized glyoxalase superfamily protein PhnB